MKRCILLSLILTLCTTTLYAQNIQRPTATRANTSINNGPKAKKQKTSIKPLLIKSSVTAFKQRRGKLERQIRVILELDRTMNKLKCTKYSGINPRNTECRKRAKHKKTMIAKIKTSYVDALWVRNQVVDRQSKMGSKTYTYSNVIATKLKALLNEVSQLELVNHGSNLSLTKKYHFEPDINPIYALAKDLRAIAPVKKK